MTPDIEEMIKASIQTAIVQSLQSTPEAINTLVKAALSKKVDQDGKTPSYGEGKLSYLEYIAGELIRQAARDAVREALVADMDTIKQNIRAMLSTDKIVDGMSQKILGIVTEEWRVNVTFADKESRY